MRSRIVKEAAAMVKEAAAMVKEAAAMVKEAVAMEARRSSRKHAVESRSRWPAS